MSRNIKKTKIIFFGALILILVIISVILLLNFTGSTKMLYGTYEYVNEEGEKSIVRINKDNVYLENLNYEDCELLAFSMYRLEQKKNSDEIDEGSHLDYADLNEKNDKLKKELSVDYKAAYDKKENSYIIEEVFDFLDNKKTGEFSVLVKSDNETVYGIAILVNPDEKTCMVGLESDKIYNYTGK